MEFECRSGRSGGFGPEELDCIAPGCGQDGQELNVQSLQIQTDGCSLRIFSSGLHCFHLVAACSGQLPLPAVHPTVVCPVARRAAGTSGMEREVCIREKRTEIVKNSTGGFR